MNKVGLLHGSTKFSNQSICKSTFCLLNPRPSLTISLWPIVPRWPVGLFSQGGHHRNGKGHSGQRIDMLVWEFIFVETKFQTPHIHTSILHKNLDPGWDGGKKNSEFSHSFFEKTCSSVGSDLTTDSLNKLVAYLQFERTKKKLPS